MRFLPLSRDLVDSIEEAGFDIDLETGFETLNTSAYQCQLCMATDRDRLSALFLDLVAATVHTPTLPKLLDIAPSTALSTRIKRAQRFEYRSADLEDPHADDRVDVQSMSLYGDDYFDGILCSHVLEHVPDDVRAMRELCRVVRPGGWVALLAPIAVTLVTPREDPSVNDPLERTRIFGQWDHLRLYAKSDFLKRLRRAGFSAIDEYGRQQLGPAAFERHGLVPTSILYVARRNPSGA